MYFLALVVKTENTTAIGLKHLLCLYIYAHHATDLYIILWQSSSHFQDKMIVRACSLKSLFAAL